MLPCTPPHDLTFMHTQTEQKPQFLSFGTAFSCVPSTSCLVFFWSFLRIGGRTVYTRNDGSCMTIKLKHLWNIWNQQIRGLTIKHYVSTLYQMHSFSVMIWLQALPPPTITLILIGLWSSLITRIVEFILLLHGSPWGHILCLHGHAL